MEEKRKRVGTIAAKSAVRLNIGYLRKKLAQEPDETERQILSRLLTEEQAKLAKLMNHARNGRFHVVGGK